MPKRKKTHYATRGRLYAEGQTKSEAKASLELMIEWACSATAIKVERRFDQLIIVAACAVGWQSKAFPLYDLQHGEESTCFTMESPGDYCEVLQSARVHAAQNAWSPDTDDELHVSQAGLTTKAGELRSWIRFQRNYRKLAAQGLPAGECHEQACRMN